MKNLEKKTFKGCFLANDLPCPEMELGCTGLTTIEKSVR